MREFWDARAAEDPFYFVDSRLRYRDPDLDRFWQAGREDLDRILEMLGVRIEPSDEVVEIGCGVGRMTRAIAERTARVRALDVSTRMIALAREQNAGLANVEWIVGDGTSLTPIAGGSCDVCFSHVVFQHIPDPAITLGYVREMGRVLRRGGWTAFQVSNAAEVHRLAVSARLRSLPARIRGRAPRGQSHPAWLGSSIDLSRLRAVADEAGLDTERVVGEGTQWCLVLLRRRA